MMYTFISAYLVIGWVVLGWLFATQSLDELTEQEPSAGARASEEAMFKMMFMSMIVTLALGWPITLWAYLDDDEAE